MPHRVNHSDQNANITCRCRMRMSDLCKVEMSGFIPGGRRDGNGANCMERERAGAMKRCCSKSKKVVYLRCIGDKNGDASVAGNRANAERSANEANADERRHRSER
jgi:hypothetical protein